VGQSTDTWSITTSAGFSDAQVTSTFFGAGETGVWTDFTDLTTMFTTAAGSTPVSANNDPVGRINDKSPNAHVLISDDGSARPLYQTNSGLPYVLFDGTNDYIRKDTSSMPLTTFYAIFGVVGVATLRSSNNRLFGAFPASPNDYDQTTAIIVIDQDGTNRAQVAGSTSTSLNAIVAGSGITTDVVEIVKTATTCEIIINGVSLVTDSSFTAFAATSGNNGFGFATTLLSVKVGGAWHGYIVEALWSSAAIAAGGSAGMRTRVGNKLGLNL
jgi:hypothetical protein